MDSEKAPVRTEFERPPNAARGDLILGAIALLVIAVGVVLLILGEGAVEGLLVGGALVVLGILAGVVAAYVAKYLKHPHRVRFLPSGVSVELEGRSLEVPWSAVESWDLAEHQMRGEHLRKLGLCAVPAAGVDPKAGGLDRLWSSKDSCWVLCEPHLFHREPAEIAAAVNQFAADKHRPHWDR